jgi:transcriptional regulator with XRE-family HTH domain
MKPYIVEVTKLKIDPDGLREWMKRAGIKQSELARRAKLSRSFICDLLKGTRQPSEAALRRIEKALS